MRTKTAGAEKIKEALAKWAAKDPSAAALIDDAAEESIAARAASKKKLKRIKWAKRLALGGAAAAGGLYLHKKYKEHQSQPKYASVQRALSAALKEKQAARYRGANANKSPYGLN